MRKQWAFFYRTCLQEKQAFISILVLVMWLWWHIQMMGRAQKGQISWSNWSNCKWRKTVASFKHFPRAIMPQSVGQSLNLLTFLFYYFIFLEFPLSFTRANKHFKKKKTNKKQLAAGSPRGCWLNVPNTQYLHSPRLLFHSAHQEVPFIPPHLRIYLILDWMEFNNFIYSKRDGRQEFLSAPLMRVIGYTTSCIFSRDTMRIWRKERKKERKRRRSSASPAVLLLVSD